MEVPLFCPKCDNTLNRTGHCTDCLWWDGGIAIQFMRKKPASDIRLMDDLERTVQPEAKEIGPKPEPSNLTLTKVLA